MRKNQSIHDDGVVNPSKTATFVEVVRRASNRRKVLQGGLGLAATFMGAGLVKGQSSIVRPRRPGLTDFRPVTRADAQGPWPTISEDYQFQILIPWGEPLTPDGPRFRYPPTPDAQEQQVGIGHDGMEFFPERDNPDLANRRGLLALNHEFGTNSHVFRQPQPSSLRDVRRSQHAHGVSIVGIERVNGVWKTYQACNARRIHVNTPMTFSGPAADHNLLKTPNNNPILGTVNNCGSGVTPWGTYLTCEENFNGYFGATHDPQQWNASNAQSRYGFSENGFGYGWHLFDGRFDLSNSGYRNEENRFGWVVEIDPYDDRKTPVKRTALGRFKHESVAVTVGKDRRIVAYMGDDQQFDYIYKFVSDEDYVKLRYEGKSPFDHGKLYVAKFNDDFTGDWIELSLDDSRIARRFTSPGSILIYARLAADAVDATPMDRPEWTTVANNGLVYCALTNNSSRETADAANPQAPNSDGHIIQWLDTDMHVGTKFSWDIFKLSSDTHGSEESYSDPDALYCDPDGRLFIATDGGQQEGMNNQLLVADTVTRDIKRLFSGVSSDEVTGITMTPDRRTLFVNIQHPGNGDIAQTDFPRMGQYPVPRDATIVITRKNGGIVGT